MSQGRSHTSVLVADDSDPVRAALVALLQREPHLRVVGEARDGAEAVRAARELQPDLVLIDLRMPVLDGLAASREIATSVPGVRIIMLSAYADPSLAQAALDHGAERYITKGSAPRELLDAIHPAPMGSGPSPEGECCRGAGPR